MHHSGKQSPATAQSAKLAEIQGLIDMEVVEEVNLDEVKRSAGKVISCW